MTTTHLPQSLPAGDAAPTPAARRRPWWPTRRRPGASRFLGLDAARGLAVLGMVIAHAAVVGVWGEEPSALLGFAHGHSSILFATIAGVSLTLVSGGATPPSGDDLVRARLGILTRAVALLIISGALTLLPPAVAIILASYALWFILAIPFLRWRPRALLIAAGVTAVFGGAAAAWLQVVTANAGASVQATPEGFVPALLIGGTYPAFAWMAFVFAGMAIGRAGLTNTRALRRFAAAGAALFVLAAAPFVVQERSLAPVFGTAPGIFASSGSSGSNTAPKDLTTGEPWSKTESSNMADDSEKWGGKQLASFDPASLWTLNPHSGSPFESLSSGGLAMFTIAGLTLLGRRTWAHWPLLPLLGVGAMSLTAYVAHAVVLGFWPKDDSVTHNWYVFWLCLGLVVACGLWCRFFTSGPLEQAVGALTDRAKAPLR
ncbi:MAG: heparan-alpha-glucosaminide N-acetyltransferase domain-containing protein [Propionibacteriaceae bacterium]|nr:heparan-alpha-glucosaminide N-acetyltransferase domain-containing protein [Propionibacteriaceae bacterium]